MSAATTDNEVDGENNLCLGFLEETDSWKLSSKFFPSKVGGKPAWLALKGLPKDEELCCQTCKQPLTFLCQLYLPNSKYDRCFHRSIFVFVCREGSCSRPNTSTGMRAFRCQLSRYNKYYPSEPPLEDEISCHTPSAQDHCKLCVVCGAPGDKKCSQCHCTTYCSRKHQAMHWKDGHKQECKTIAATLGPSTVTQNSCIFPEAEVILEPQQSLLEEEEKESRELSREELKREVYKVKEIYPNLDFDESELLPDGTVSTEKGARRKNPFNIFSDSEGYHSLEQVAYTDADSMYTYFKEQMAIESDQVIRYHRGGSPLYCSSYGKPGPNAVKKCPHCLQTRQFEFQILPQMLSHLKVDALDGPSLDWGVLLVYTCFCDAPTEYTEEQIIKQDYAEIAGLGKKKPKEVVLNNDYGNRGEDHPS